MIFINKYNGIKPKNEFVNTVIEGVVAITRQVHFWSKMRFYCRVIVKHVPHRLMQESYSSDYSIQMYKENLTWLTISWQKIILLKTYFMSRLSKKNKWKEDNSAHFSSIITNVFFSQESNIPKIQGYRFWKRISYTQTKIYTFLYKTLRPYLCCILFRIQIKQLKYSICHKNIYLWCNNKTSQNFQISISHTILIYFPVIIDPKCTSISKVTVKQRCKNFLKMWICYAVFCVLLRTIKLCTCLVTVPNPSIKNLTHSGFYTFCHIG